MKTLKYIFLILCLIFLKVNFASAAYSCAYSSDSLTHSFEVDSSENKIKLTGSNDWILDSFLDNNYSDEKMIKTLNGGCPDFVYVCEYTATINAFIIDGVNHMKHYSFILNGENYENFKDSIDLKNPGGYVYYSAEVKRDDCKSLTANESESTGKIMHGLFSCSFFNNNFEKLKKLYCDSKEKNCTKEQLNSYNNEKKKIIEWCNSVLKNSDYVNPCAKSCVNLYDSISEYELTTVKVNECGFSERLINFIINISKWVRYIIPVAVIILGIIDFLRALSSDKDDGLKKAQGRFIRRVIAAALIFIIPFILEFIIEKMGFVSDTCGII